MGFANDKHVGIRVLVNDIFQCHYFPGVGSDDPVLFDFFDDEFIFRRSQGQNIVTGVSQQRRPAPHEYDE
jgi:hypothetical protein